MQLAGQTKDPDQKMSPSIYAALVDSLFQNPAPMFAGAVFAAVAAVMTALKSGDHLLWPCAALLIVTGAVRAVDMQKYKKRNSALTADEAGRWEIRYQIAAMFYAVALGIWCFVALTSSDDPVAHMIAMTVTSGYMAAGVGRTYGRPWIFHVQIVLACGPMTLGLAMHGDRYYIGMAQANHDQSADDFRSGTRCPRARSGARKPVRHRPQQHAAWPVHVCRRWPSRGHESPLQRHDEPVG
jgi:hypothetical protein